MWKLSCLCNCSWVCLHENECQIREDPSASLSRGRHECLTMANLILWNSLDFYFLSHCRSITFVFNLQNKSTTRGKKEGLFARIQDREQESERKHRVFIEFVQSGNCRWIIENKYYVLTNRKSRHDCGVQLNRVANFTCQRMKYAIISQALSSCLMSLIYWQYSEGHVNIHFVII